MRVTEAPQALGRPYRIQDVPFILLAIIAALPALAAMPIWLEQAFSYSALVGRPDGSSSTAAAGYACRADFVAWLGFSTLSLSLAARFVALRMTTGLSFLAIAGRDMMEHLAVVLACWLFEWSLQQEPVRFVVGELAARWCSAK